MTYVRDRPPLGNFGLAQGRGARVSLSNSIIKKGEGS